MSTGLSPALRALLDEHVDSFDKLEVLMAVHRAANQRMTVREVAAALDLDRDDVRRVGAELMSSRLVVMSPAGELAIDGAGDAVAELASVYATDRVALVTAIADRSLNRLRSMAGRAFSEAFVIRKKPRGEND